MANDIALLRNFIGYVQRHTKISLFVFVVIITVNFTNFYIFVFLSR